MKITGTLNLRCFKYPRDRVGPAIKRVIVRTADSIVSPPAMNQPAIKGRSGIVSVRHDDGLHKLKKVTFQLDPILPY